MFSKIHKTSPHVLNVGALLIRLVTRKLLPFLIKGTKLLVNLCTLTGKLLQFNGIGGDFG
jgi:hypothetical protein